MEYLYPMPIWQVVVCKKCKYAVLPSHIDTHFASDKHRITKAERQRIANAVADIYPLIGNEETLRRSQFTFPSMVQPELEEPKEDGLGCALGTEERPCHYICCSIKSMKEHCKREHGWKSQNKGGRPRKFGRREASVPWRTGIHCQRFFVQGPKSQYFEVQPRNQVLGQSEMRSRTMEYTSARQRLKMTMEAAEQKEQEEIKEMDDAREPNPWLRRVGWAAHLIGFDRAQARGWIREPTMEAKASEADRAEASTLDQELEVVRKAFDWMIQDTQFKATQDIVGQAALFEANRKEANKEPQTPLDSWMDNTTIRMYTHVWHQLLFYIFRTRKLEQRPGYRLTPGQERSIEGLLSMVQEFIRWRDEQDIDHEAEESDEEIAFMQRIQREVVQVCIAMLYHPLGDDEYKSVMISGLAILGIRDDNGWLGAEDYNSKYSAIIKLARMIVVREGCYRRHEQIEKLKASGIEQEDAEAEAPSYYHMIRQMTTQFMVMAQDGRDPTPMQWIYKARSYGFKIRYTTAADGCIQWIGDDILYQKIRFGVGKVKEMVKGLIEEASECLFANLMMTGRAKAPKIHWESMADNPAESRVGWSFLDDERSRFDVDGRWWLYKRMFHEQSIRERFRGDEQAEAIDEYSQQVEHFKELMLCLVHLCYGQPARAPEILGFRWQNSPQGDVRNIFIEDGLVAMVAMYHKGYRSSNNIKIIHRYLPREVGELLVYYLWLVRPFHEKLEFERTGQSQRNPFLWGDGRKVEHRQWTGPQHDRSEEKGPGSGWTSGRLRKALQSCSSRYIGEALHISAWRQISIAISRRYCRKHPFPTGEPDQEEEEEESSPWDLQAGHGSHVAGMIYARELMEGSSSMFSRREQFREVSKAWHRFLELPSGVSGASGATGASGESGASEATGASRASRASRGPFQQALPMEDKRKHEQYEADIHAAQIKRQKRVQEIDLEQTLKIMVGPEAQFRGVQRETLEGIVRGENHVLSIMSTGAGKTLMFQLPAFGQRSSTTVVIVPLKSLEQSLYERCIKAGLTCIKWDASQRCRSAQVILVQPESAVSIGFAELLNRLEGLGQLDRIVWDECHTVLESNAEFRPQMREVGRLMKKRPVQKVYLTATLSPEDEPEFCKTMDIQADEVYIQRGITTRPNIAYSIWEHARETEPIEAVRELVAQKSVEFPAPAKIIIYSDTIETVKALAEALGCPAYYAEVGTRAEKDSIYEKWGEGRERVVVASNAFGLGIDQPDVRTVIHVGAIHRIQQYSQESGRAGRDGQRSEAIIVRKAGSQAWLRRALVQDKVRRRFPGRRSAAIPTSVDQERVNRYISGDRCRRIHLDQIMDGRVDRIGCEDGEERCDVCQEEVDDEAGEMDRSQSYQQDRMLDSGIDIPHSSHGGVVSSMPPSSPPVVVSRVPYSMPWSNAGIRPNIPGHVPWSSPSDIPLDNHKVRSPRWDSGQVCDIPVHSPASSVSLDEGVMARGFSMADQQEFQARQTIRGQGLEDVHERNRQEWQEMQEFKGQLQSIHGHCPICWTRRDPSRHSIHDCIASDSGAIRQVWQCMKKEMSEKRVFQGFSCCFTCHVPQAICPAWKDQEEDGRFVWNRDIPCEFKEIIMPVVAVALYERYDWIERIVQKQGIEIKGPDEIYRWFGRGVGWGGVQASRLSQVFHRAINEYRGLQGEGIQHRADRDVPKGDN